MMEIIGRDIKEGKRPKLDEHTQQHFQAQLEEFRKSPIVKR